MFGREKKEGNGSVEEGVLGLRKGGMEEKESRLD